MDASSSVRVSFWIASARARNPFSSRARAAESFGASGGLSPSRAPMSSRYTVTPVRFVSVSPALVFDG